MFSKQQAKHLLSLQRDLATSLGSAQSLEKVLQLSLQAALDVSGMDCGGIYLPRPEKNGYQLAIFRGCSDEFINAVAYVAPDSDRARLLQKGIPLYQQYRELPLSFSPVLRKEGVRAICIVPVLYEGQVIAALNAASHTRRKISSFSRYALETLCAQMGSTLARIQAETLVRSEKQRFQTMFEYLPVACYLNDLQGIFLDGNRKAEEICGYRREELIGKNYLESNLLLPEYFPKVADILRQNQNGQPTGPDEVIMIRKDGARLPIEIRTFPIVVNEKNISLVSSLDISERKLAEKTQADLMAALRLKAEEWRQTVDAVTNPVLLLDLQGRVIRVNRATVSLTKTNDSALLGKRLLEIGSGFFWQTLAELADSLIEHGFVENTYIWDASSKKTWDVKMVLFGSPDHSKQILIVANDVTELVQMEKLLRRNEIISVMGSLLGGVAHEVRNPLFGISATLDAFAARFGMSEEYEPYFTTLHKEINRLNRLMGDLLEFGKPISFSLHAGDLNDVIKKSIESCAQLAKRSEVTIISDVDLNTPPIRLDSERLLRAFRNVLENAIQHSPSGGQVELHSQVIQKEQGLFLLCKIRDQGPGVDVKDLPKLFEPFFSRRKEGTGLGLSIAQRVVEEHYGEIKITNHKDGGALVEIRLPLNA